MGTYSRKCVISCRLQLDQVMGTASLVRCGDITCWEVPYWISHPFCGPSWFMPKLRGRKKRRDKELRKVEDISQGASVEDCTETDTEKKKKRYEKLQIQIRE